MDEEIMRRAQREHDDPAARERQAAEAVEDDGILELLLKQHAQTRDLVRQVQQTGGAARREAFNHLRELLALHEAAEAEVLRPVTRQLVGAEVAEARLAEEDRAARVLEQLEKLDVDGPEFGRLFEAFAKDVAEHAEREEAEEFPWIASRCPVERRRELGRQVSDVRLDDASGPRPGATRPPAQEQPGPFAGLLDKARRAIAGERS